MATHLGVHEHDDKLRIPSAQEIQAGRQARDRFLARAKSIDGARLSTADRETWVMFVGYLEADAAMDMCAEELYAVSPRDNPLTRYGRIAEDQPVSPLEQGARLASRYEQVGSAIDGEIALLRAGATQGLFANAESIRRVVTQFEAELAKPDEDWPLTLPAREDHAGWSVEDLSAYRLRLQRAVHESIRSALERYASVLRDELLPNGRSDAQATLIASSLAR